MYLALQRALKHILVSNSLNVRVFLLYTGGGNESRNEAKFLMGRNMKVFSVLATSVYKS